MDRGDKTWPALSGRTVNMSRFVMPALGLLLLLLFGQSHSSAQEPSLSEDMLERLAEALDGKEIDEIIPLRGSSQPADLFGRYVHAVPLVITNDGTGSAVIVRANNADSSALLITNSHVVSGHRRVYLLFYDTQLVDEPFERKRIISCYREKDASRWCKAFMNSVRQAEVVRADPARDLALLRITQAPKASAEIPWGNVDSVSPGARVSVIGHPHNLLWSLTEGAVSQVRRQFVIGSAPSTARVTVIQTQAPVNPGNSGGPLLNSDGRLVGIIFGQFVNKVANAAAQGMSPDILRLAAPGINFAIGINEVQTIVTDFLRSSTIGGK